MLDQSDFKPFTLTDFEVDIAPPSISASSTSEKENGEDGASISGVEVSDSLASFRPLTFDVEGDSAEFISAVSVDSENVKTDAEKIQLSKGFKTAEFFQENSLLTNAEDFAESIRSGAKLYKTQLLTQIEEQASNTERIFQKTVTENQEAEQERKNLLSSTEEKVEEIKRKAYQEGFESGLQQGMQQRYDEAEPLVLQVNSVLEQLNSLRQVVRFQAEEELVKLALGIAKNVVAEELKLNKSVIQNIVQAALHETEVQGKIYLHLHPDDYKFLLNSKSDLESYLNDEQKLVLRQNPEMKPGSIYVESDEEIISRSIEGQFDKLEETLTEQTENRHAHLTEVDIDAHDFSAQPSLDEDVAETAAQEVTEQETKLENEDVENKDVSTAGVVSKETESPELSQTDSTEEIDQSTDGDESSEIAETKMSEETAESALETATTESEKQEPNLENPKSE